VPYDWREFFAGEELAKLGTAEREEREKQAKNFMHVTFVQNSEESPQKYFVANLTEFTAEGIQI